MQQRLLHRWQNGLCGNSPGKQHTICSRPAGTAPGRCWSSGCRARCFPGAAAAAAPQQERDFCPSAPLPGAAGAEVTASHGDTAFTPGDTAPFVIQVLIVPIKELTSRRFRMAGAVSGLHRRDFHSICRCCV